MTLIRANQIMLICFDNQLNQANRLYHRWKSFKSGDPNHGNQANQENRLYHDWKDYRIALILKSLVILQSIMETNQGNQANQENQG